MRRYALAIIAFLTCGSAFAQSGSPASDVYVVAIGSSSYAAPPSGTALGFESLLGMNNSARLFADGFIRGGAREAMVVTSGPTELVTTHDIQAALAHASASIRHDRPQRPLIVFYFAGHGISEGVGWNHFSIPGDFAYKPPLAKLNVEALAKRTLHAGSLVDALDKLGIPYLVLLDTCYEGREARFESPVLTGPAIDSLRNVAAVVRVVNEFR